VAPAFKPAYLIHGDDHGRIAERRARLRALAEGQSGAGGVELFEGEEATPERVAAALNAMTFALGRRFVIVDGAQRWKERELGPLLTALAGLAPETTVAFFAREDARAKAPAALHDAVRRAGGDIACERALGPGELPRWVIAQAGELRLRLDGDAARALVRQVGERQQRLRRELEKLALALGEGAQVDDELVAQLCASSAQRRAWVLGDALLARDRAAAMRIYLALRAQGERAGGLIYVIAQRLRAAHQVALAIEAGQAPAQVRRTLRMPAGAAERLIADACAAGAERLRQAIVELSELELATRGGGEGGASEDSAMLLAICRIAA
jgi:DNA polymerase-3 subunit delta